MTVTEALRAFWPLFAFQLGLMIWALVDLSRRENTRLLPRVVWFLVIVLFSMLGPIAYLVWGRES